MSTPETTNNNNEPTPPSNTTTEEAITTTAAPTTTVEEEIQSTTTTKTESIESTPTDNVENDTTQESEKVEQKTRTNTQESSDDQTIVGESEPTKEGTNDNEQNNLSPSTDEKNAQERTSTTNTTTTTTTTNDRSSTHQNQQQEKGSYAGGGYRRGGGLNRGYNQQANNRNRFNRRYDNDNHRYRDSSNANNGRGVGGDVGHFDRKREYDQVRPSVDAEVEPFNKTSAAPVNNTNNNNSTNDEERSPKRMRVGAGQQEGSTSVPTISGYNNYSNRGGSNYNNRYGGNQQRGGLYNDQGRRRSPPRYGNNRYSNTASGGGAGQRGYSREGQLNRYDNRDYQRDSSYNRGGGYNDRRDYHREDRWVSGTSGYNRNEGQSNFQQQPQQQVGGASGGWNDRPGFSDQRGRDGVSNRGYGDNYPNRHGSWQQHKSRPHETEMYDNRRQGGRGYEDERRYPSRDNASSWNRQQSGDNAFASSSGRQFSGDVSADNRSDSFSRDRGDYNQQHGATGNRYENQRYRDNRYENYNSSTNSYSNNGNEDFRGGDSSSGSSRNNEYYNKQQQQQQNPPTQQPQVQVLPADWSEYATNEGKKYYFNSVTKVSQWDFPTA